MSKVKANSGIRVGVRVGPSTMGLLFSYGTLETGKAKMRHVRCGFVTLEPVDPKDIYGDWKYTAVERPDP